MKISIGILAWNEEVSIRTTLHSLLSQSLISELATNGHEAEIICVPNGCSDNTALAARGALMSAMERQEGSDRIIWKVHELQTPGKTNAWNVFVHELSDPEADLLFLVDADIQIYMPDTLQNMLNKLNSTPEAFICSDLPVKHLTFKQNYSLLDQISLQTSRINQAAEGQLCGQLYCARASFLRRFRIPGPIIVEDGFIKKMAVTNLLTEPQNNARIVSAETASHVFEAYTRPSDVFATQRRQTAGYIIHRWTWEFLLDQQQPDEDAGKTIERLCQTDPDWAGRLITENLNQQRYRSIYKIIANTRLARFKNAGLSKKIVHLPLLVIHLSMERVVFSAAVRLLKKKSGTGIWRDTRTTNNEVAR